MDLWTVEADRCADLNRTRSAFKDWRQKSVQHSHVEVGGVIQRLDNLQGAGEVALRVRAG